MADSRSSGGEGTESTLRGRSSDAKGLAYAQVSGLPGRMRRDEAPVCTGPRVSLHRLFQSC